MKLFIVFFLFVGIIPINAQTYEIYLEKAMLGDAYSMARIGQMLRIGEGVKIDTTQSLRWTLKAVKLNQVIAKANYAFMLKTGFGVKQNLTEADSIFTNIFPELKTSCDSNNNIACYWISEVLNEGLGQIADKAQALKYLEKSADSGYSLAENSLGLRYLSGINVPKNPEKAFQLIKKAADQGDQNSISNLAYLYDNGIGTEKNLEKAFELFLALSERNDPVATYLVGNYYLAGKGTAMDEGKAKKYYKQAANMGNVQAQRFLLRFKDSRVDKLIETATDNGDIESQLIIAIRYYWGKGVPKNYDKAVEHWKKAINLGSTEAINELACFYYRDRKQPGDTLSAIIMLKEAVSMGSASGCFSLGHILAEGTTPELRDIKLGVACFILGKKFVDPNQEVVIKNLKDYYDKYEKLLSKDELKSAEEMAEKMWHEIKP